MVLHMYLYYSSLLEATDSYIFFHGNNFFYKVLQSNLHFSEPMLSLLHSHTVEERRLSFRLPVVCFSVQFLSSYQPDVSDDWVMVTHQAHDFYDHWCCHKSCFGKPAKASWGLSDSPPTGPWLKESKCNSEAPFKTTVQLAASLQFKRGLWVDCYEWIVSELFGELLFFLNILKWYFCIYFFLRLSFSLCFVKTLSCCTEGCNVLSVEVCIWVRLYTLWRPSGVHRTTRPLIDYTQTPTRVHLANCCEPDSCGIIFW